jgi:hypothetical protein
MNTFIIGVENYCKVKFIGDDNNHRKYYWFSNIEKIMLKNGFGLDEIITTSQEVFDVTNLNNYFKLEYEGNVRYFTELMLDTFMINKYDLNKFFISVDELIKNNNNFIFLIDAGDYVSIDRIFLSEKILKCVNDGKCKIVLNTSYEPYSQEQHEFMKYLEIFSLKYNLNYDTLKIMTGNLIVKNDTEKRYEFIPYCYFLENPWFVTKDVFPTDIYHIDGRKKIRESFKNKGDEFLKINDEIQSFDKKILCYNRRPHPHRRFLFWKMINNEILYNNAYISLNNQEDFTHLSYNYLYNVTSEESEKINNFYINNRVSWSFDGYDLNFNLADNFEESFHKKTFISLVSETSSSPNVVFFSEKIFKPIYACQPFIISGNARSLEKLKELGFRTFDKWWDESYDLDGRFDVRLNKIIKILEDICNKTDEELSNMLREMRGVLEHNYNVFVNSQNEHLSLIFKKIQPENKKLI